MHLFSSLLIRRSVLAACAFLAISSLPAGAETCNGSSTPTFELCATPAYSVTQELWGELAPVDNPANPLPEDRDNSDFDHATSTFFDPDHIGWFAVDGESGYLFTAGTVGFQVWDARNSHATNPVPVGYYDIFDIPYFAFNLETKFYFRDVDAPPDDPTIVATALVDSSGLVVFNTSSPTNPVVRYQDHGESGSKSAFGVYSATIGGRSYAFMAAHLPGGGVYAYDLTTVKGFATVCAENAPTVILCPGVYKGKIGSRSSAHWVDGAGDYLAMSSGAIDRGFEIWNVSNPASPVLRVDALGSDPVGGVALWQRGSSYYLAARVGNDTRVYDVSCITGSGSCTPGSPVRTFSTPPPSGTTNSLTWSRSSTGREFLYVGDDSRHGQGTGHEWLIEVTSSVPGSWADITPPAQTIVVDTVNGPEPRLTGYWGWYYMGNPTGTNWVAPMGGKWMGEYFYRSAYSILDVHQFTTGVPPTASFTWSSTSSDGLIYPDTPINFVDTSTPGSTLTAWSWSFSPDGVPATSTSQNPTGVTFPTLGNKSVSLLATNAVGSDQVSQVVTVLDPSPTVTSVSASPSPALVCQSVTFTAQGVGGQPPLQRAWTVKDGSGGVVASTSNGGNSFAWSTDASTPPGTYTGEIAVSNAQPDPATARTLVVLQALPALAFTGAGGAPTFDPFSSGTVQLHVLSSGATEWNWDFGDGSSTGWVSDPVDGPNPIHSYTAIGSYQVTVQIRNCVEGPITSAPVAVEVTQIDPLEINVFSAVGCNFGFCSFPVGTEITFTQTFSGDPDQFDYDWNGDGSFEQTTGAPITTHTYNGVGSFVPVVRIRRGAESVSRAHDDPIIITNDNPPPTPSVSVSGPSSGFVDTELNFTATASNCSPSPSLWSWTLGSGGSFVGASNGSTITATWSTAGSKLVRATAQNGGCSGTAGTRSVVISTQGGGGGGDTVTADFTVNPENPLTGATVTFDASVSTGDVFAWDWDFGDSTTASGEVVEHVFEQAGSHDVTLSITGNGDGAGCFLGFCSDAKTLTVEVTESGLVARFDIDQPCDQDLCYAEAGAWVHFTDRSLGNPTSFEWSFGDDTTEVGPAVDHRWFAPGNYTVQLSVSDGVDSDSTSRTVQVTTSADQLLLGGRFLAEASWRKPDGTEGTGRPFLLTEDSGYLWFFREQNVEIFMKVLDGCTVNEHFWVFASGLTNVEVNLTVTDTETGDVWSADNPQGTAFAPIQDIEAFAGCGPRSEGRGRGLGLARRSLLEDGSGVSAQDGLFPPQATCVPNDQTLCLNQGRFEVQVRWETPEGATGTGQTNALTDETGDFWFFREDNLELLVKVLRGCDFNDRYWVFAAGLTNVGVEIDVTDMETGDSVHYQNPVGEVLLPIQDIDAFASCE